MVTPAHTHTHIRMMMMFVLRMFNEHDGGYSIMLWNMNRAQ